MSELAPGRSRARAVPSRACQYYFHNLVNATNYVPGSLWPLPSVHEAPHWSSRSCNLRRLCVIHVKYPCVQHQICGRGVEPAGVLLPLVLFGELSARLANEASEG